METEPANPAASSAQASPPIKLSRLTRVLSDPTRWAMMRELAKGEALPVALLATRVGVSRDSASKHMAVLRQAGVTAPGLGRLYSLTPPYRPAPGATHLDFGHCLIRLAP